MILRPAPKSGVPRRGNSRWIARRNGRWARDADEAHSPAGSGQYCEGLQQIPRALPGRRKPPRPGRENSPTAGPERALFEEHQPRMTRAGGASSSFQRDERRARVTSPLHEARGTKTARATRPRLGCRGPQQTPERDGPGGRHPRTARRGRHTPKGCERIPQERRPSRSVRRPCAGRRIDPGR